MRNLTILRYALTRLTLSNAHLRHWSIITLLLFFGASNLMADDVVIKTLDWSASEWSSHSTICNGTKEETVNGVKFTRSATTEGGEYIINDGILTFTSDGNAQNDNRWIAVPIENIKLGKIKVNIAAVSGKQLQVKYQFVGGSTTIDKPTSSLTASGKPSASQPLSFTIGTGTATNGVLYFGRNGSSENQIGKVTISYDNSSYITVKESETEVNDISVYNDTPKTFTVSSNNSTGAISLQGGTLNSDNTENSLDLMSGDTKIATAVYTIASNQLTITPVSGAKGTATLTLNQAAAGDYSTGSKTISVEVKKHNLTMSYSPNSYTYNATTGATGDLTQPTLTITDESVSDVKSAVSSYLSFFSEDPSLAEVDASGHITIKGTGIAVVRASVKNHPNYNDAAAEFTITKMDGYQKEIANHTPAYNETLEVKNASDQLLLTVRFGGYKYSSPSATHNDTWGNVAKYTGPGHDVINYIDNFTNQSQADNDARSEGAWQHNITDPQNGSIDWFSTSETKPNGTNYTEYERIKPFSLPVRGAYMKFEPEVSGVLTAYVLQNGILNFKEERTNTVWGPTDTDKHPLATNPRVYYWFDQDGWLITPLTDPVVKQPITIGIDEGNNGSEFGLIGKRLSMWVYGNETATGDANGTYKDLEGLRSQWPNNADVATNLAKTFPDAQPIIHYRGGYLLVQKAYVKYEVPVVAGKSYYFFSNASKLGFAGVNFRPYSAEEKTAKKIVTNSSQAMNPASDNAVTIFKPTGDDLVNTYNTVTLDRTFKQNTWNTICLPFHVTEAQVKNVFGDGTKLVIFNGISDSKAHLLQHVDQNILAGQPYFIYPTKAGITSLTFHNVSTDTNLRVNSYGNDGSDYKFIGTLSQTSIKEGDYYINAKSGDTNVGKLTAYKGTTAGSLNTYRAFIQKTSLGAKAITGISFSGTVGDIDEDNMTTGIMEILINEMKMEVKPINGVFNLQGQKVSDSTNGLPAGMYIINGKKVAIK